VKPTEKNLQKSQKNQKPLSLTGLIAERGSEKTKIAGTSGTPK